MTRRMEKKERIRRFLAYVCNKIDQWNRAGDRADRRVCIRRSVYDDGVRDSVTDRGLRADEGVRPGEAGGRHCDLSVGHIFLCHDRDELVRILLPVPRDGIDRAAGDLCDPVSEAADRGDRGVFFRDFLYRLSACAYHLHQKPALRGMARLADRLRLMGR